MEALLCTFSKLVDYDGACGLSDVIRGVLLWIRRSNDRHQVIAVGYVLLATTDNEEN